MIASYYELKILDLLTASEIVMILLQDPGWTLPHNGKRPRERMVEAWALFQAGAAAVAGEHRLMMRDISTEAA